MNRSGGAKSRRRSRRRRSKKLTTVEETSAGGLVVDSTRRWAALIGRLGRHGTLLWSLPKGHIEEGESAGETAVREVREETGITARVESELGTIDYWFVAERKRIHKTVHHFILTATGGELSDEDIEVTEVAWVPVAQLNDILVYSDERRLVHLALEQFAAGADSTAAEGAGE